MKIVEIKKFVDTIYPKMPNSRGVLLEQLASMGGTGADSCEQESLF